MISLKKSFLKNDFFEEIIDKKMISWWKSFLGALLFPYKTTGNKFDG